jgi:hypothetical protein
MKHVIFATILVASPMAALAGDIKEVGNCNDETVSEYRDQINKLIKTGDLEEKKVEAVAQNYIGELKRSESINDHACMIMKAIFDEFEITFE